MTSAANATTAPVPMAGHVGKYRPWCNETLHAEIKYCTGTFMAAFLFCVSQPEREVDREVQREGESEREGRRERGRERGREREG